MEVMRQNRIVCKEDDILWRYHQVKSPQPSRDVAPGRSQSATLQQVGDSDLEEEVAISEPEEDGGMERGTTSRQTAVKIAF